MKGPSAYDDEGWIDENVASRRLDDFKKLFRKIRRSLDKEPILDSISTNFDATAQAEHRLFRAVADGFAPKEEAKGSDSGFEIVLVNPLYEKGLVDAEGLLAKSQANTQIHLCFVSCVAGRENSTEIASEINNISDIFENSENKELLKQHLESEGKSIRSVQYLTITRDKDSIDLDFEVIRMATNPDHHAIWTLIEGDLPDDDGDQTLQYASGSTYHPKLEKVGRNGIETTNADHDDIRFCLTSHPVFPIGEVCMRVYLDHITLGKDNPKHLKESEFENKYREKMQLGHDREEIESEIDKKVESLIQLSLDAGILDDDVEAPYDYKIMWQSDDAGDIKDMVKEKYFKNEEPDRRGEIAFEKAKERYNREEQPLSEFGDSE